MTTNRTRRVIISNGWQITQVADGEGGWWNIDVKRVTGR